MIPLPGFFYFDPNFIFHDGEIGRKLFVVLIDNIDDNNYVLVARTTTKPKSDRVYGCHTRTEWESVFFIPAIDGTFNEDTWVQFDYLKEYESAILERWTRKGELTLEQTKAMLICASDSYTLSLRIQETLKEHANLIHLR